MSKPYPTVSPYLITTNANKVLDFLKKAFDAVEVHVARTDAGKIQHATLKIEDSVVMMGEATEEYQAMPCMLYVYMNDCDASYQKAIAAGGESIRQPTNEAYGERSSGVKDAGGNQWWIAGPLKS